MNELTPNEIDELMDRDPEHLSSQDIDKIIATHRQWRAKHVAGVKPKRGQGQKAPFDVTSFVQNITKQTEPKVTPPSGGGMRR